MLARQGRVNILLGKGVEGTVSVNLYDVALEEAVRSIAYAAGYTVEKRNETYMIVERAEAGKDYAYGNTQIRTFKVQYTDPAVVAELLTKHLSRYGKITTLRTRSLLVVEDLPDFVARIHQMLAEIDLQPRQILIEAKVLQITLDADSVYGIDWSVPFRFEGGDGIFGTQGLAPRGIPGFFLEAVTPEFEIFLNTLSRKGRVRTLSTPKLLVLENQEAEVIIGDRLGYRLTTTINQVTTESVEFLESGVILRVKAAVDRAGRVLLDIHPEVSTGTVQDGLPEQNTTAVTTQLLAANGQGIFIGGLIRENTTESRTGIPLLSEVPVLGNLFSRTDEVTRNTETIVLITPHIVDQGRHKVSGESAAKIGLTERELRVKADRILRSLPSTAINKRNTGVTNTGAKTFQTPP